MKPIWYVVLYSSAPPVAAPLMAAAAKDSYCARLKAEQRSFVVFEVKSASLPERRLLEAMVCVSAEERMQALVALNRIRIDDDEWRFSFWECAVCDVGLDRPSACGCCGRPDCALRRDCRCLCEYAVCPDCDSRLVNCTCPGEDKVTDLCDEDEPCELGTVENCNSCRREFRSYGSPWCDACIVLDEERKCAGC